MHTVIARCSSVCKFVNVWGAQEASQVEQRDCHRKLQGATHVIVDSKHLTRKDKMMASLIHLSGEVSQNIETT